MHFKLSQWHPEGFQVLKDDFSESDGYCAYLLAKNVQSIDEQRICHL